MAVEVCVAELDTVLFVFVAVVAVVAVFPSPYFSLNVFQSV